MKRILVPTDFSEASQEAIQFGLALTNAVEGEMLLLHVVEGEPIRTYAVGRRSTSLVRCIDLVGDLPRVEVPAKLIHRDLYEEARWKLSTLLPAGAPDRFRALVTVGKATSEIVRIAREQDADLIVMGMQGRRGWRHLLRRSVATKVSHMASVPVIRVDAKQGDLRLHAGGLRVPDRRSDTGTACVNHDEVCGGAKKTDLAHI